MTASRILLLHVLLCALLLPTIPALAQEEAGHLHGPDGRHIAVAGGAGGGGGVSILSHHDLKITDEKGDVVKGCDVHSVIYRRGDPNDVIHREHNVFEPENGVYGSHMVYKEPGEYVIAEKVTLPGGKAETVEFPVWVPAVAGAATHADGAGISPLALAGGVLSVIALVAGAFVLGRRSGRRAAALLLAFALTATVAGASRRAYAQEEAGEEAGHLHGPDGRHIAVAGGAGSGAGGPVLRAYPGPNREESATKSVGGYQLQLSIENEELKPDPDVVALPEEVREAIGLAVAEAKEASTGGGLAVTGQVRRDPNRAVTVGARVGGRIAHVGLTPGDRVRAGHVVAVIDSPEVAEAQADLRSAAAQVSRSDAAVRRAVAQVAEARAGVDRSRAEAERERARVRAAQVTLSRQRRLASEGAFAAPAAEGARLEANEADGEFAAARTALAALEAQEKRVTAGLADGVVARKEVEAAQSAAEQGRTRVATAERQRDIARAALTREESIQDAGLRTAREVQQSEAELAVTRAALRAAEAVTASEEKRLAGARDNVAEAEAERTKAHAVVAAARDRLRLLGAAEDGGSRVTVTAPVGGEVETRPVNAGELVQAGQPLASILNADVVWVESDVFEKDLPRVKVGQGVTIAADAAPGKTFPGRVGYIGGEVNPETRAVRVRTVVTNRGEVLKPNMFVRVLIAAAGTGDAVTVPRAAVQEDEEGAAAPVVFVEEAPGAYRRRTVKVGPTLGEEVVVESGLLPGESVVTTGAYQILSRLRQAQ